MTQDPSGSLAFDPTREARLVVMGAMCGIALIGIATMTFMFEVLWRRGHRPWWMLDSDDRDDAAMHEPDARG